jgi:predicted lipoprotein with Yx(FWY)xxD motif
MRTAPRSKGVAHEGITARRVALILLGALAALVLAGACSSAKSSKAATAGTGGTSGSSTTAATGSSAASGAGVFKVKVNDQFGQILADAHGLTLYTFTNGAAPASCDASCLAVWPAATVPATTSASATAGVNGLGTTMGPNGATVLDFEGKPLYTFVRDKDAGDAYGDGLNTFGGTWHVVKVPAGATANGGATSSSSATTTTAASGGAGGY